MTAAFIRENDFCVFGRHAQRESSRWQSMQLHLMLDRLHGLQHGETNSLVSEAAKAAFFAASLIDIC